MASNFNSANSSGFVATIKQANYTRAQVLSTTSGFPGTNMKSADPLFTSIHSTLLESDLTLKSESPNVNAGIFPFTIDGSGSGQVLTLIPVVKTMNAKQVFFPGDVVQIEGFGRAEVKSVSTDNQVTLTTSVTYSQGAGFWFPWAHSRIDIGAYQVGATPIATSTSTPTTTATTTPTTASTGVWNDLSSTQTGVKNASPSYFTRTPITASASGTVSKLRVRIAAFGSSTEVRLGLYSSSGAKLTEGKGFASAAGYFELAVPAVNVTQGVNYYIAAQGASNSLYSFSCVAATGGLEASNAYASGLPSALPGGWSDCSLGVGMSVTVPSSTTPTTTATTTPTTTATTTPTTTATTTPPPITTAGWNGVLSAGTGVKNATPSYFTRTPITPSASGSVSKLRVRVAAFGSSTEVRLGLYSSSGKKLTEGKGIASAAGYIEVAVPTVNVTQGVSYYIAVQGASNSLYSFTCAAATGGIEAPNAYTAGFPSVLPGGWSDCSLVVGMYVTWGMVAHWADATTAATSAINSTASYLRWTPMKADVNGTVDKLRVRVAAFGSATAVRVGLYNSSRRKLTEGVATASAAGYLTVTVPAVQVTQGSTYYLAVEAASNQLYSFSCGAATGGFEGANSYSAGFPSVLPNGWANCLLTGGMYIH